MTGEPKVVKQVLSAPQGFSPSQAPVVFCPGRPRTKGSLKPVHIRSGAGMCRVSLTESGEYATTWKREMIKAIKAACVCERYVGPVVVDLTFRFERLCKPDAMMAWPTREGGPYGHGDVDKLVRNAYDALTQSALILDDSLIVGGRAMKRWVVPGEQPGVEMWVCPA